MASPAVLRRSVLAFAALALTALIPLAQSRPASDQMHVPVLVELFTSEGCSDCPADRLLQELDSRQPIPGARAIVLSEHVTYWNHLGWIDPFSMNEIDLRQKDYGEQFNLDSVYTPQAVIDGSEQLVGNNAAGVARAIERAAATPKRPLDLADVHWEGNAVTFTVRGEADARSKLVAALAADATGQKIARGENAGRTLHHVAVVRSIRQFGPGALDGRRLHLSAGSLAHDRSPTAVRLVAFVVDRKGHVTAVSEQILSAENLARR
jgi:hypothetical protein